SMVGQLTITGEPAGAEVMVNGQSVGKLPLAPLHLGKGDVEVELRAPGYESGSKTVSLAGGATESVSIVLARTASPPPTERAAAAGTGVAAADAAPPATPAAAA